MGEGNISLKMRKSLFEFVPPFIQFVDSSYLVREELESVGDCSAGWDLLLAALFKQRLRSKYCDNQHWGNVKNVRKCYYTFIFFIFFSGGGENKLNVFKSRLNIFCQEKVEFYMFSCIGNIFFYNGPNLENVKETCSFLCTYFCWSFFILDNR